MRPSTILVLATIVIALSGCANLSADEIAKKMQEKYESIEDFRSVVSITFYHNSTANTLEYEYVYKKPNKVKMVSLNEDVTFVSNGEKMWSYDRKSNRVFVFEVGEYTPKAPDYGTIVEEMLENYNVELVGSERVSGRDCYVIRLTPKNDSMGGEMEMWVDMEYWFPLKIVQEMPAGKMITEYRNVRFNIGIDDSEFEFEIPEGAEVVTEKDLGIERPESIEEAQKMVNFTLLVPEYTASLELRSITVVNGRVVTLMYGDGGRILTVSESADGVIVENENSEKVRIGDLEGSYAELFGSGMLSFEKDGVVVAISGNLEKEELIKVAESMI
ncbi:outer membrane lipoprotein-sorting protein [Geoglobus ahangari]